MSAILLAACASTKHEPMPTVAYSNTNSMAFNIAKQTDLLSDYEHGMRTFESPLRDFTSQDIEDINTALTKRSGGGASKFLGVANILTGNFTGAISLAGGLSADLSNSTHPAAKERWIIAINSKEFTNELMARKAAFNSIEIAITSTFIEYGFEVKYKKLKNVNGNEIFVIRKNKEYNTGFSLGMESMIVDDISLQKQIVNFGRGDKESYVNGISYSPNNTPLTGVSHSVFYEHKKEEIENFTYDEFMERVTAKLGENYFYYQPNFSKFKNLEGKTYTMLNDVIPKIYTNGKRYDFIKP